MSSKQYLQVVKSFKHIQTLHQGWHAKPLLRSHDRSISRYSLLVTCSCFLLTSS